MQIVQLQKVVSHHHFLRGCEAIRVINWDEFLFFFFFFVMVVANCNESCYWLHVHCSQWQLLLFFPSGIKIAFVAIWRVSCGELGYCEMWAYFMHDKLWVKWTSSKAKICCSKLNVFLLIFATDNELISQGEERETTSAKLLLVFSRLYWEQRNRHNFFVVSSQKMAAKKTSGLCVSKKLKVLFNKEHRNSLLFGYYKIGFRCLELNSYIRIASI